MIVTSLDLAKFLICPTTKFRFAHSQFSIHILLNSTQIPMIQKICNNSTFRSIGHKNQY